MQAQAIERSQRDTSQCGPAPSAEDVHALLNEAASCYREHRHIQAENLARRALTQAPDDDQARYWLAVSVACSQRTLEAIDRLEPLVSGDEASAWRSGHQDQARHAAAELQRLRRVAQANASTRPADGSTRWSGRGPAKYQLDHLDQEPNQDVGGPIQDDEALLLYATVRTMRMRRILEIGGLNGYSARNFLTAMGDDDGATLYTVDINPVPSLAPNHFVITGDCASILPRDLHFLPLDLIFFDAHVFEPQMAMLERLQERGLVTDATVLALHDTNVHPIKRPAWAYAVTEPNGATGFVHQAVERQMVNALREKGWDALCFHVEPARCDRRLPVRHGITLMRRFRSLVT